MVNQPVYPRIPVRPVPPENLPIWPIRPLPPYYGYPPFIPTKPLPGDGVWPPRRPIFPVQPIAPLVPPQLRPLPSPLYIRDPHLPGQIPESPTIGPAGPQQPSASGTEPDAEQLTAEEGAPSWLDALEGTDLGRQILFQSLLPTNATRTQALQFQNLFHPVFTQFLSELGSRVRSGGEPNLTFDQFLSQNFDPQRALLRLPEASTGALGGRTAFNFG